MGSSFDPRHSFVGRSQIAVTSVFQVMVSAEKAAANPVGPRISVEEALGYEGRRFFSKGGQSNRETEGDGLHASAGPLASAARERGQAYPENRVTALQPCFSSVVQDDW